MLDAVPPRYCLAGTGFTKVTLALNNPTPLHYDDNNFGVTFLEAFDVNGDLASGRGTHVLVDRDFGAAVQVRDRALTGVVTLGDYRRVLHANRAVGEGEGERFIMTAYCSMTLVDLVRPR